MRVIFINHQMKGHFHTTIMSVDRFVILLCHLIKRANLLNSNDFPTNFVIFSVPKQILSLLHHKYYHSYIIPTNLNHHTSTHIYIYSSKNIFGFDGK